MPNFFKYQRLKAVLITKLKKISLKFQKILCKRIILISEILVKLM